MSAITSVYLSRLGFATGADGRARWSVQENLSDDRKQTESDQEQKVFQAPTQQGIVAYGIPGTAYNDDRSVSTIAESQRAADTLLGVRIEFPRHKWDSFVD